MGKIRRMLRRSCNESQNANFHLSARNQCIRIIFLFSAHDRKIKISVEPNTGTGFSVFCATLANGYEAIAKEKILDYVFGRAEINKDISKQNSSGYANWWG